MKEGSGVAANALKNLDIDLAKIRRVVERIVPYASTEAPVQGLLPQTPRTKKLIEHAIDEARRLNHNYVGTEHLLLGLLRDREDVANQVLMALGLKLKDVRAEITKLLEFDLTVSEEAVDDPPAILEPEPVPEAKAVVKKHLKRLCIQVEEAEMQKWAAVRAQDFDQAAGWRDVTISFKRLIAQYEELRKRL
jgi:ATP-dependent Clp protease ATP-binding subunit ClpA